MKRSTFLLAACAASLLTALPAAHAADAFPSRPLTLVIPFPPGGPTDAMARTLAAEMKDRLGQPMLNLTRPRYVLPVHGEYRHLLGHAKVAASVGIPDDRIFVLEDGMAELGRVPDESVFLESWISNSNKVFAVFRP